MSEIYIINDIVGPMVANEPGNFWTYMLKELPAKAINFAELQIPLEEVVKKTIKKEDLIINNDLWGFTFPDHFTITIAQNPFRGMQELLGVDLNEQIEKQKRALKESQVRVAVSNYMAESYKDCGTFKVIPVGTDPELFKPMNKEAMREKYGIPSDRIVFISVLSHHAVKGWTEIKREVDQRMAYWILVFKDFPEPTQENTKVFCRIPQGQVAELLNCADFFVSKSVCESGGLAAIEAMFCDIPVLSTRTGIFFDYSPPMVHPRKEAFEKGLDKETCIKSWKKLIEEV